MAQPSLQSKFIDEDRLKLVEDYLTEIYQRKKAELET